MKIDAEKEMIPGLPESVEDAIALIDDVETSSPSEWAPLERVLDRIGKRYEAYAC